jgi:hypothetical protein
LKNKGMIFQSSNLMKIQTFIIEKLPDEGALLPVGTLSPCHQTVLRVVTSQSQSAAA